MGGNQENTQERAERQFIWTPEMVKDVEKFIENLADRYLQFKKNEAEADQKYIEAAAKHNRHMTLILATFLAIITLAMGYLTINGRVSGDALLFLTGTITGYVLLFIQRLVLTSATAPSEAEETRQ